MYFHIVCIRVRVLCAGMNSYVVSQRLRTIKYELRRSLNHHNSKNAACSTEVAWRGYWPLLLFLVITIFTMSWHRPWILRAWKQVIGSRNRTLDSQNNHAARSGNRTLDLQKWLRARPGVQTLDRLKKIVRTIVHAITKYDRAHNHKISRAYKIRASARASSMWNVSAGRWRTARLTKNGRWTDRFKVTKHPERSCSLQNISF